MFYTEIRLFMFPLNQMWDIKKLLRNKMFYLTLLPDLTVKNLRTFKTDLAWLQKLPNWCFVFIHWIKRPVLTSLKLELVPQSCDITDCWSNLRLKNVGWIICIPTSSRGLDREPSGHRPTATSAISELNGTFRIKITHCNNWFFNLAEDS